MRKHFVPWPLSCQELQHLFMGVSIDDVHAVRLHLPQVGVLSQDFSYELSGVGLSDRGALLSPHRCPLADWCLPRPCLVLNERPHVSHLNDPLEIGPSISSWWEHTSMVTLFTAGLSRL